MNISYFEGFTSKQPTPSNLNDMAALIMGDKKLESITNAYRQTHNPKIKGESPLFAVACTFVGGKAKAHITSLTQLSLVDLDHIVKPELGGLSDKGETLDDIKKKINADPHTLMCYTTISGEGLRVIYRYELDTSFSLAQQIDFYPQAFAIGNAYYEKLLGCAADPLCKNVTRLSGLAYDPDLYCNANSVPFSAEEIQAFHANDSKAMQEKKKIARIQSFYDTVIAPMLAKEDIVYEPGNHNKYVMRVGYLLAKKRYSKSLCVKWAKEKFTEYDGTEQVFNSCFANAQGKTQREANGNGGGTGNRNVASVEEIMNFLDENVHLRHNEITGLYEIQVSQLEEGATVSKKVWQEVKDSHINTLWRKMSVFTRVYKGDMLNVIESDYTRDFHPFKDYLEGLRAWHPDEHDFIADLAATVFVKQRDSETCLSFYEALKKWLVGMVASWVSDAINELILVFVGEQGVYKTTWFNYLLPPELKQYFYTKTNANRMSKDDLIALSQYGLICYEELDTMRPADLNQLKAAVTMRSINERGAYAHYAERRKHINSFCATGNNPQFLTDPTGNRRWLPFEVEKIVSPREHPFPYEGMYAQAYALYKSGFKYWFENEESQLQSLHNKRFDAPRLETELVDLYFRKPGENENGQFISVANALQIISGNVSQKLSAVNVGKAFVELGFQRVRTSYTRGFLAIVRTAEEIRQYQITLSLRSTKE